MRRSTQLGTALIVAALAACATAGTPAPEPDAATPASMQAAPAVAPAAGARAVPVTTDVEEARRAFDEGRMLASNLRQMEAREQFDRAIAADPDFALAYVYRAALTPPAERGEFLSKAQTHAAQASEGERQMIAQYTALDQGDPERRLQILEQLAATYPQDKYVLMDLANMYYGRDDYDRATQNLQRVLEVDPDFAPAYNMLGYAQSRQGNLAAAEQAFQSYTRAAPSEPNPYDSLGELYLKMGRYDEARTQFQKAVQTNPRFFVSRENIGMTHLLAGQYDEARRAFQTAMDAAETPAQRIDMQFRIAESYVHQGQYEKAKQALARAETMAREANNHAALLFGGIQGRVLLHRHLGENAEAAAAAAEFARTASSVQLPAAAARNARLASTFNEAMLAARSGDFDAASRKANEFASAAEAQGGGFARYARPTTLGMIAFEKKDYAEAIRQLERADQEDPYVLYQLALAQEARGNEARAREYFQKVVDLNTLNFGMEYALVRKEAREKLR